MDIKGNPNPAIASTGSYNLYNDGLDGIQIEIAPSRNLQVRTDSDVNNQLELGITSIIVNGLGADYELVVTVEKVKTAILSLDNATDMFRTILLGFNMSNLISQT